MTEENKEKGTELKLVEVQKNVRELVKLDYSSEEMKEMVIISKKITVPNLEDTEQLKIAKDMRTKLRKVEIVVEKQAKNYRDFFNKINKEIRTEEMDLLEITKTEIERLDAIQEEADSLEIKKKREALLPVRKERLTAVDETGCYICADEYLVEMDADAFEKYLNGCVANKNERERLRLEDEAEAKRVADQKQIDEERAELDKEKQAIEDKKIADEEVKLAKEKEDYAIEQKRREALLPDRKVILIEIEDTVPALEDRLLLAMDDNEFTTYYNNRVTAKNTADKQAIEDKRIADAKIIEDQKIADNKIAQDKIDTEAHDKLVKEKKERKEELEKVALEKMEKYKTFLKENGWTAETRDQFESRPVQGGFELWKKVGTFTDY